MFVTSFILFHVSRGLRQDRAFQYYALLKSLVLPITHAWVSVDDCNILFVIQYSCGLFQSHTLSQYFDLTDCRFYLYVNSADNGLETKRNE